MVFAVFQVKSVSLEAIDVGVTGCSYPSSVLGLEPVRRWKAYVHDDLPGGRAIMITALINN